MRPKAVRHILDQCLDDLARGASIESCLYSYPQHAEELEPLLQAAACVQRADAPEPSEEAQSRALAALRGAFAQRGQPSPLQPRRSSRAPGLARLPRAMRLALIGLLAVAILLSGTVAAAQRSLPGQLLYQVKLGSEQIRIALAPSHGAQRSRLHLIFARRRAAEARQVATTSRGLSYQAIAGMLEHYTAASRQYAMLSPDDADQARDELVRLVRETNAMLRALAPLIETPSDHKLLGAALNIAQQTEARFSPAALDPPEQPAETRTPAPTASVTPTPMPTWTRGPLPSRAPTQPSAAPIATAAARPTSTARPAPGAATTTPTALPAAKPSPTSRAVQAPSPAPSPSPVPATTPAPSPTHSSAPAQTPEPSPTHSSAPAQTPEPTRKAWQSPTPAPRASEEPARTPVETPAPTMQEPAPSATPIQLLTSTPAETPTTGSAPRRSGTPTAMVAETSTAEPKPAREEAPTPTATSMPDTSATPARRSAPVSSPQPSPSPKREIP